MIGLLAGTGSTVVARPALAYVALARPYLARPSLARPYLARPYLARPYLARPSLARPALAIAVPDTATRNQLDTTGLQAGTTHTERMSQTQLEYTDN